MNTSMLGFLDILVAVLLVGSGIYSLYSCIKVKKEQALIESKILYPSNCPPEDCLDPEGFMSFIVPRMTFFGIMCVIFGIITVITSFLDMGLIATGVETVAVLAVFVYISIVQNRSSHIFW